MSAIKLPVRLETIDDGANEFIYLVDADDNRIEPDTVAAALNAAPKRAFAELTAEALKEMRRECFSAGVHNSVGWKNFLSRLQAFTAPVAPAWRPIETAPKDGVPILCFTPDFQAIFSPQSGIDVLWWDEGAWLYNAEPVAFPPTHWQPLPAAPEDQGGSEHD